MKTILISIIMILALSLQAKTYRDAEEISRTIPIVSIPKIEQKSSMFLKSGQSMNSMFVTSYPITLSYNNYFHKNFAWVFEASYSFASDTDLKQSIENMIKNSQQKASIPEHHYSMAHVMTGVIFKPIYGKITFFSEKIIHFDTYITMGVGTSINKIYKTETTDETTSKVEESTSITGALFFALGQNYFLTNSFALNFEIFNNITLGDIKGEFINQHYSIRFGMQYLF
ncbi:outer membrane beta-barrel domain-containing protein [bacterium]|nr:outer membrane beta-barrel domain-containing protein [bacterium]